MTQIFPKSIFLFNFIHSHLETNLNSKPETNENLTCHLLLQTLCKLLSKIPKGVEKIQHFVGYSNGLLGYCFIQVM
jgi:hypothetical protein